MASVQEHESAEALRDDSAALIDTVRRAHAEGKALVVRGGNTKRWYGRPVEGSEIDTRGHVGVVDYEPSELVIVARAGTPLAAVEALLARHRQMLPFEPPRFAPVAPTVAPQGTAVQRTGDDTIARALAARGPTLGGVVAAGLSGPRRMAAGSVRDFVLGARLIDGRGQHLAFGGRVMKNVAGYDVSRALAGSLGTLGLITEVALKVLPIPAARATLSFTLDEAAALQKLNEWAGQPLAITASAWRSAASAGRGYQGRAGRLMVRLEGSEAAVQSSIRRIGGLDVDAPDADALWRDLREQTDRWFATRPSDLPLWRLALPPTAPSLDALDLGFDDQLIEWGGAQRWIATNGAGSLVRETAERLGGHATLWRATDAIRTRVGVFTPLSAPLAAIHRRLKAEFDPANVFNRGRLYPDL